MAPGAGAVVADRIPTTATGEVGRGQRLGQHDKVGDLFEVHRGGEAHRSRALDSGGGSADRLVGARL
jgi:hypothetical protein